MALDPESAPINRQNSPQSQMGMKLSSRAFSVVLVLAVFAFVGANVTDYLRFTRAVGRATWLTENQLRAIADRSRQIPKLEILKGKNIPLEFLSLRPVRVIAEQSYTGATLYNLGELYVDFSVHTSPSNQQVLFSTNEAGYPRSQILWQRDPELAKRLSPDHRLITIQHESREWIVFSKQILVIDRPSRLVPEERIVASVPLSPEDRLAIGETIRAIPPSSRGKSYRAQGIMHGSFLAVRFAENGERSYDDIETEAAWTDMLEPLLNTVSKFVPKEHQITFKQAVFERNPDPQHNPIIVMSLREFDEKFYPRPKTPWWCVWRSFIGRNDSNY